MAGGSPGRGQRLTAFDTAISSQANNAIVLAAFAFAAFIFLLNTFGSDRSAARSESTASLEGRALFLLAAAFSMGVLTAFLYSTSASFAPAQARRGFAIASVAFGLEVLALIAPVVVPFERYLDRPGPQAAWWIALGLSGYTVARVVVEHGRTWTDQRPAEPTAAENLALLAVALVPVVAMLSFAAAARRARTGTVVARLWRFVSCNAIGYAVVLAASGLFVSVVHMTVGFRTSIHEVPWWVVAALSFVVGSSAA